ncbi:SDR family NAD(P)-dependent oxidoreductase [Novosphingobium sp. ES2-1]|uniref:SDR family NAD(P)-dependent oxidoreductase n=1 Tax=Novosphingobium sp. ES2-1 TaxID=2780074 RepID=UPI0018811384|nr:SDR family NAD(P)-dependent oxidoreductase [Novosphingobium sp. ES2-1]QOV96451.1 SDR family NAD(P)-dependent oxidoreductase [Novosphingobium sp. ES2-1]
MSGKVVVVTGGFGSLGRVVARAFADNGDRVARLDIAPAAPDTLSVGLDLPGLDLTDEPGVAAAVARIEADLGGIDVLVNIAGGFTWETVADGSLAAWERMFATNLRSTVTITRAALPAIRRSQAGRVINLGAEGALKADTGFAPYAASKAGIHKLTEALAAELAGSSVTVNAILPSTIDTPVNRADMPDADFSTWVTPQAIADVILFLASKQGRAISGALLPVSRGGD